MKNCAIVGANGFLGRELAGKLSHEGYNVYAVYRGASESIPSGCIKMHFTEFVELSIDIDCIFFSAGSFSSNHSELISLHCSLLRDIVEKFAKSRIVFISSTNVFGVHEDIIRETSCYNSPGIYGQSKLAGEFVVSSASSYAILRMTYLYGSGLDNHSFIPNMLKQATEKGSITLFGKGEREQDYMHVDDAVAFCIKAMHHNENGIFLGATGRSHSNLEAAQIIANMHPGCVIEFQEGSAGASFYFDPSETCSRLNWRSEIPFPEGLKTMIG